MGCSLRSVLRRLRRDEAGQSLIIVVSSMAVLLALAGAAIDTATWMVRHHQAQIVADSAALAAAQCLADPRHASTIDISGTQTPVPACTNKNDATDAQQVAVDYAAANGLTISAGDVSVDTKHKRVTVSATATSPGFFARFFGLNTTTQSAIAGAGYQQPSSNCGSPGGSNCDFMFAHDSNCAANWDGIVVNTNGNATIQGNIQSNSNLSGTTNGVPAFGTATYGPNGTGTCSNSMTYNGHDPWATDPTQASVDYPFPVDYTKDFPACGGSGEAACVNGYPPFCTNEGANITLNGSTNGDTTITGNIYCAVGTGTPSDPSTWNGTITIGLSGSETLYATFVGGSINFTGNGKDVLASCGYSATGYTASTCNPSVPAPPLGNNYPMFYATGSSSTALSVSVGGSQVFYGDMFAPNGGASVNLNGNKTLTSFIEANDINAQISGTFQGDGPMAANTGTDGPGTVALVQ
ncbi:MAG TPA: pilus assembly protein TadG-related protein [Solirubrobacteraceae bacterium]|nr:pilus assembly protein TadG-related protein [Solirubrobacteraceae bacterium]